MLPVAAIGLGIVLGLACGGRAREVVELDNGTLVALIVLSLAQGIARGRFMGLDPTGLGLMVWLVASVFCCAILYASLSRQVGYSATGPALMLVVLGTLLNALTVLLNQGMPVASWPGAAELVADSSGFYVNLNDGSVLPLLGDVMLVALGDKRLLLSVGDVALFVGVVVVLVALMTRRPAPDTAMSL